MPGVIMRWMRGVAALLVLSLVGSALAEKLSPLEMRRRLGAETLTAQDVKDTFGTANDGEMRLDGLDASFAISASGSAKNAVAFANDNTRFNLRKIGDYFVGVGTFDPNTAGTITFRVDDRVVGRPRNYEAYLPDPMMRRQEGVAKGELRAMGEFRSKNFPGTKREWWVYIPSGLAKNERANLLVVQDAQWGRDTTAVALDNLIAAKQMPKTIAVMVTPGEFDDKRSNRSFEYDRLAPGYSSMIIDELLPIVEKDYKLKTDPADRAIMGNSSGGICAFTACWLRPENFGVCISWIGSFVDLARLHGDETGGDDYPSLIRKAKVKPIRVFLADGTRDLENDFGNWPLANRQMIQALRSMGYDAVFLEGPGFHSGDHLQANLPSALRWAFRGR
ncbi:enterochelin esterase [bacterium]|nr:MAG: enterochelin esterase [bacterium]